MKKTLLTALLITSLVGCSEQSSSQPKQEKKAEVSHPAPAQPAPAPTPAPQPPPNTDKQDLTTYSSEINPYVTGLSKDMKDIATVSNMGANDPSIITTDQYQKTVQTICDDMKTNIQGVRSADTLNNPKIEDIQNILLQAMDKMEYIADNFPNDVNTLDATGINECNSAMSDATNYITQTNDKVNALKSSENMN